MLLINVTFAVEYVLYFYHGAKNHGAPRSTRIVQDTNRVMKANTPTIIEHRGVIVLGLGNQKGKGDINLKACSPNWVSKRKKKVCVALDP